MKKQPYIYLLLSLPAIMLFAACGLKKPKAEEEREQWLLSLNDSIAKYQRMDREVSVQLDSARRRVASLLPGFDYVNDPRQVEGYYIAKGWRDRYPLETTGMVARITEDISFELVATLTGANFNEISVTAGGETVRSAVVPHDQALNYRTTKFNKVCFSGSRADSIGRLVATHQNSPVSVTFLNGSRTGQLTLPADQSGMIAATWRLFDAQRASLRLEKELPRLAGKINACRRMLESTDSVM